jgi:hypothetical protein
VIANQTISCRTRRRTKPGNRPASSTPAKHEALWVSGSLRPVTIQAESDITCGYASEHQTAAALRVRASLLTLAPLAGLRTVDYAWQILLRWNEIYSFRPALTADLPAGGLAFVKALRRCRNAEDHGALKKAMPSYYDAFSLWVRRPAELRWQVEARILARQSWDAIAAKSGLAAESLRLYERLYYRVTDQLDNVRWVLHEVIGWHHNGPERIGAIWQYYGYRGGPDVLDTLLYGYPSSREPETLKKVRDFFVEDCLEELLVQRMLRARMELQRPGSGPAALHCLMQSLRRESKRLARTKAR